MARGPKIVGGSLRGRSLRVVGSARPTESRVREALFNIWAAEVPGCRFLDLFAGSGSMGFEALSRGGSSVTWVERHGASAASIRRAVAELGAELETTTRIVRAELPSALSRLGWGPFDLVYADPPYAYGGYGELVSAVAPLLAEHGVLAVEHSRDVELPEAGGLLVDDRRSWGDCAVTFWRLEATADGAPSDRPAAGIS